MSLGYNSFLHRMTFFVFHTFKVQLKGFFVLFCFVLFCKKKKKNHLCPQHATLYFSTPISTHTELRIRKDNTHPSHSLFTLSSGKRFFSTRPQHSIK